MPPRHSCRGVETSSGRSLTGTSLAAETCRHLTGLSEWKWIRQAKAVKTLVFSTRTTSVAPVFIRSLALVRRFVAVSGADLTPLESFHFTNRNRAESLFRE